MDLNQTLAELEEALLLGAGNSLRLTWGCVVRSEYAPDGEPAWSITTRGGERVWLTLEMLEAVRGHHFWLQGHTLCQIEEQDLSLEPGELVADLLLHLYHAPVRGEAASRFGLVTQAVLPLGCPKSVFLLATERAMAWPF